MADAEDLREYIVANMFDGDDSGVTKQRTAALVDNIVDVVIEYLEELRERVAHDGGH